jgi:hypothetical protein
MIIRIAVVLLGRGAAAESSSGGFPLSGASPPAMTFGDIAASSAVRLEAMNYEYFCPVEE